MVDVFILPSTFTDIKRATDSSCPDHRILKLLEPYSCFKEQSVHHTKHIKKNTTADHARNQTWHRHNHNQRTIPCKTRRHITNDKMTDDEKAINTLLNKVSERNYNHITSKILGILNDDNVQIVVQSILTKCQKQICFIDMYINIIRDVSQSGGEVKRQVILILTEYINDFVDKREFNCFNLENDSYTDFCNNMEMKNVVLGKHKTIISVMSNIIMQDNVIDSYFEHMFNEIVRLDNTHGKCEIKELLLDIMKDFASADSRFKSKITNYYITQPNVLTCYTLKAKFKVMDITDNAIQSVLVG